MIQRLRTRSRRARGWLRRNVHASTVDVVAVGLGPEDAERFRELAARDAATSIHAGTHEHDPVIREILPEDRVELLHERMTRGDECHVVLVDGEPVGWCWFARRSHRDAWSGLWIELKPGEIYVYDLFIKRDRRRGGLGSTVMRRLLLAFSEEPSTRVGYGWVEQYNTPQQRLLRDLLGWTQVGTVQYARLFDRYGVAVPFSKRPRSGPVGGRPWPRRRNHAQPKS